jgi:predicted enzyme related to lactoylglutathione lyase
MTGVRNLSAVRNARITPAVGDVSIRTTATPEEHTMTATIGLVLDCADPAELATFWSEALGYTTAGEAGNYVLLVPTDSGPPKLLLQAVAEAKATKNRMHLDIETPDVDAEVIRLESLGAQRLEADARSEHGSRWVIMADPEGNEFCVCNAGYT